MRGWEEVLPSRLGAPWPALLATDGSCLFPKLPCLATAAAAVAWGPSAQQQMVDGGPPPQTAQRAEVAAIILAAVMASRRKEATIVLTDSAYVVSWAGTGGERVSWPPSFKATMVSCGQASSAVAPAHLQVDKVPAHRTVQEALAEGIPRDWWLLNQAADLAAGQHARCLAPPPCQSGGSPRHPLCGCRGPRHPSRCFDSSSHLHERLQ